MKKRTVVTFGYLIVEATALLVFVAGIWQHDWLYLIAGFLLHLRHIEIVHWQGEEII